MKKTIAVVLSVLMCVAFFAACSSNNNEGGSTAEAGAGVDAGKDAMSYTASDWEAATDEQKDAAARELAIQLVPGADQLSDEEIASSVSEMRVGIDAYFQESPDGTIADLRDQSAEALEQIASMLQSE